MRNSDTRAGRTAVIAVVTAVVVSVITAVANNAIFNEPRVGQAGAIEFLKTYYQKTTDPAVDKGDLWKNSQTEAFRKLEGNSEKEFKKFYASGIDKVVLVNVAPGTVRNQFAVTLKFLPPSGKAVAAQSFWFTLACSDQLARLPVRECASDKIQIDVIVNAAQRKLLGG